jgi:methionine synthase / methylenetetrahydrofolate reductase(NADPH)
MANLLEALGSRVVIGDGSVAASLYAEGVPLGRSFEGMNLVEPDRVTAVHRAYLEAGAELIATNSFAANRSALKRHGLEDKANEINWKGGEEWSLGGRLYRTEWVDSGRSQRNGGPSG